MRLSYNWIKTMVNLPEEAADIDALCDKLDMTGTGVEGVEKTGPGFTGVVVGRISKKEHHKDSDHLWVCQVDVGKNNLDDDGDPEPLQIVCGAQNFEEGDKIPVALVGAVLPGDFKIKKSKLRGVVSNGMNCSGKELCINDDHEGILILPKDAPIGDDFASYLGMGNTVLDLEITPNRPDCMSMLGMARELGAMYDVDTTFVPPVLVESDEDVADYAKVTIINPDRCPRYTARVIKDVEIKPSPEWMIKRLVDSGARAIDNIVDATNYILFELGQPLHAFDYDKLAKDDEGKAHIVVRKAYDGEPFTTLDNVDRVLTSDMTVIADGNRSCEMEGSAAGDGKVIALAGVMGGLETEIDENTKNVLLESATFESGSTSRTSRNLQLFSESSARYERGVDANTCEEFSAYAAALISEISGASVCKGVVDVYPQLIESPILTLRPDRLRDFIGAPIENEDITRILTRLGCEVSCAEQGGHLEQCDTLEQGENLTVVCPTYRPDLTREIDLYEEVLRLWGTERVEDTLPKGNTAGGLTPSQKLMEKIGLVMRACGVNETMTYSFVPDDDIERFNMQGAVSGEPVVLMNPLSSDMSVLRRSLVPSLLRSVAFNLSRGVENVHLYEIGTVFQGREGQALPFEPKRLACVLHGHWNDPGWSHTDEEIDFFDGKGIIENLARELAILKLRFISAKEEDTPWLQPGCAAIVKAGKRNLGWIGLIHPKTCEVCEVHPPVVAFELDADALIECSNEMRPYVEIPQYPPVDMDMAIVVEENVSAQQVINAIKSSGGNLLEQVKLFDVYRDEAKLGHDLKSLALSLTYRHPEKTLTFKEVDDLHQKVITKVCKATGGKLRS